MVLEPQIMRFHELDEHDVGVKILRKVKDLYRLVGLGHLEGDALLSQHRQIKRLIFDH